ncbi:MULTISPECIES: hypothetical protein [Citrobacter]|nr:MULTISPECIES: hypothetical protein [Citrobacter]MDM3440520.1 hypothetical protein [Citrobacter sp. Cb063]WIF76260.1 hypothetical protein QN090_20890 [Citrobacter braakii]
MTTITRFTKEQLLKRLEEQMSSARYALGFVQDSEILRDIEMDLRLAEIARASLTAEPIGAFHISDQQVEGTSDYIKDGEWPIDNGVIEVYTAPPAQVVPENYVTAEHRRVIEMLLNVCGAAFELADDSCQQEVDGEECHVVPDDAFQKLSDALDEIENTLPTEDVDRPDVFLAWSAMPRAALKSILQAGNSPVIGIDLASEPDRSVEVRYLAPPGYVIVPIVPTEDMIINGFESVPDPHFSDEKEWEEYEALSGCRQAARRAELCWAAMIKAAPKQENI